MALYKYVYYYYYDITYRLLTKKALSCMLENIFFHSNTHKFSLFSRVYIQLFFRFEEKFRDTGGQQLLLERCPSWPNQALLLLLHPLNGLFFRTTWVSQYHKGKTSLDWNEAIYDGVLGCNGISWTICKQSAPRSRQITTPSPITQFLQAIYSFQCPTNSVKALKAT